MSRNLLYPALAGLSLFALLWFGKPTEFGFMEYYITQADAHPGDDCDDHGGDWDGDGVCADFDCDDSDPTNSKVQPDCGGCFIAGSSNVDNDGDGYCDDVDCNDAIETVWDLLDPAYIDGDGDGYDDGSTTVCWDGTTIPAGYNNITNGTDCDDSNGSVWDLLDPAYIDGDGDGYDDGSTTVCWDGITAPAGYNDFTNGTDCDDANGSIWESMDLYIDGDGDGYDDGTGLNTVCTDGSVPSGYSSTTLGTDCDDNDFDAHIDNDNDLVCDFYDCNDNDGSVWENMDLYIDFDGDGYDDGTGLNIVCTDGSVPSGYSSSTLGTDCDDNDFDAHIDNDNDLVCDFYDCNDNDGSVWENMDLYIDFDGDGYDDGTGLNTVCTDGSVPSGYSSTTLGTDCDDNDFDAHIDNDNDLVCDFYDCNDNDGSVWENMDLYIDFDGDGYDDGSGLNTVCTDGSVPSGYSSTTLGTDCDDNDFDAHIDNDNDLVCDFYDCNDNDGSVWENMDLYIDFDGDGYDDGSGLNTICTDGSVPSGYSSTTLGTDCDDNDFDAHIDNDNDLVCDLYDCNDSDGSVWENMDLYIDFDGDGYDDGTGLNTVCTDGSVPSGYSSTTLGTDCDDNDFDAHIDNDNDLVCDFYDCNDNDGSVWENMDLYIDFDGDGYDDGTGLNTVCTDGSVPSGYSSTTLGTDCDDNDFDAHIDNDNDLVCDFYDCNDNDGSVWENMDLYIDFDGDGYDDGTGLNTVCTDGSVPSGYSSTTLGTDCDDNDFDAHIDNDNDLVCDFYDCNDNDGSVWENMDLYIDFDGDGYDDGTGLNTVCTDGSVPSGYSTTTSGVDCDDNCSACFPGNQEICDGLDNDCDGIVDNDGTIYYADLDNDFYYNPNFFKDTCAQPAGYISLITAAGIDCNDNDQLLTNNCPIMTYYVDSSNTGSMLVSSHFRSILMVGESWDMAFTTLQAALATVSAGDTIKVAQGTYFPGSTRDSSFIIPSDIVLLGGYPMGGGTDEERNWDCNKTILSGDIGMPDDSTDNSYHVVVTVNVDSSTVVDGFTITEGQADGVGLHQNLGGGWFNDGSGTGNYSNPTIRNTTIWNNYSGISGGGVYNLGTDGGNSSPNLINCLLSGNTAADYGGGMYNEGNMGNSSPMLINCIVSGNYSNSTGGGLYNCGIDGGNSSPTLINTIISGNSFGIYNNNSIGGITSPVLVNCIVWNNAVAFNDGTNTVSYSMVQSGSAYIDGGNNKPDGLDPLFYNAPDFSAAPTTTGDFHLLPASPAIDMGTNTGAPAFDLEGNIRPINITDIGAYETSYFDCTLYTAEVIYVDSSAMGANNGTSWANAFNNLQDALFAARLCDQIDSIKVARGTYYPSQFDTLIVFDECTSLPSDTIYFTPDSSISFNLPDSLALLGGYEGVSGDTSAARDWVCNKTILCGDIGVQGVNADNSLHVVVTTNIDSAIIDGFYISGGNADNGNLIPDMVGGGWYNDGSGSGNQSNPTINNCVISGNNANHGGGMYNNGSNFGNASPILTNVVISGNNANQGGGLYNNGTVSGNASPILINMVISGNYGGLGGGMNNVGITSGNASPILTNVVISGNNASEGGALFNAGFDNGNASPTFTNCILWKNFAISLGPVFFNVEATPSVSYSIIQGNSNDINDGSITSGGGTINGGNNKFESDGANPLFIYAPLASMAPTSAGNFHVLPNSSAIDMGTSAGAPAFDFDYNPRPFNFKVDIGAYETSNLECSNLAQVLFVDSSATGLDNGLSWTDAFNNLQDALFAASICSQVDTIKVAQGTYYPSMQDTIIILNSCPGSPPDTVVTPLDQSASFVFPDSLVIQGGYEGITGDTSAERNWICNKTILCGDIDGNDLPDWNSYRIVVTVNSDSLMVDGFIIQNAFNEGFSSLVDGGAWHNSTSGTGKKSSPKIFNTSFLNNETDNNGAAFYNHSDSSSEANPLFVNCQFRSNKAFYGAATYSLADHNSSASPVYYNCILSGNFVDGGTGAVLNTRTSNGGNSRPVFINSSIISNAQDQGGPVFYNSGDIVLKIINSIVWNNNNNFPGTTFENNTATTEVSYSIIQPGGFTANTSGENTDGNKPTGTDPLLVNVPGAGRTLDGDFHLLFMSPAVNMGLNTENPYPTDIERNQRIQNGTIDIGAYEISGANCSIYTNGIVYVDSAALGMNNGSSWLNAFTDLQDALEAARFCNQVDTVKVAHGTYYPSDSTVVMDPCGGPVIILAPDRTISFNIPDSTVVLGGYFGGSGADSSIRDWVCNKTILCGDIDRNGDSLNNSYHVVVTKNVSDQTIVDGFCISGGNATPFEYGGGWFNDGSNGGSSEPVIINCIIQGNVAYYGGGLYNEGTNGNSSPTIINCIIRNNTAISDGGGIYNDGELFTDGVAISNPVLINTIISGNRAGDAAGGIYNEALNGEAGPRFINCVIAGNYGSEYGAMFTHASSLATVIWNTIVWNNGSDDNSIIGGTGPGYETSYSIIQPDGIGDVTDLIGNKTDDPAFYYSPLATSAPTAAGNFHLLMTSAAIDMGTLVDAPAFDLDYNTRPYYNTVDIGAYEFIGPVCSQFLSNIVYVDSSAVGALDGNSWPTAFKDLQDALLAARFCDQIDTIKVARGTYFPSFPDTIILCGDTTIFGPRREDFFFIPDSVVMLGGYPSGGSEEAWRMPHCNLTIMSGDINHDGDSSGNTFNVVKTIDYADTIIYDGFVIEQGNAIPNGEEGGGWWDGSNHDSAFLCIRNTVFRDNYALFGGGFYGEGTRDLKIIAGEFYDNYVTKRGGAIYFTPPIGLDTAHIRLENMLIHHNQAEINGGAIGITITEGLELNIINATMTQNLPDAINNNSSGVVNILNSIVWNNGATPIGGAFLPVVNFSIVQGVYLGPGANNKMDDPLFQDPNSNFHLQQTSPAIDMGENSSSNEATDLDGLPRIARTIIDMGAYESILDCSPDTLYVLEDGTVPDLPLDSILRANISDSFLLLIDTTTIDAFEMNCDNLGENSLFIRIVRACNLALIDSCTKRVWIIDTFENELGPNGNLTANDKLNISMDEDCMIILTPEDVLNGIGGCSNNFEIVLQYPNGTNHYDPPNKVDRSHVGYCFVYTVRDIITGNSTWGEVCIEDKSPAFIDCLPDTVTCFELAQLPQGSYTVSDNCSGQTKVVIANEQFIDYGCDSPNLLGVVTRRLIASDDWGNSRSCNKQYYILKTSLDSVICPADTAVDCSLSLVNGIAFTDPKRSRAPYVLVNGLKVSLWPNSAACKLSVLYRDEKFQICGGLTYKVLRTWIISDWCTGLEKTCKQWISVTDKTPPTVLETLTVNANASPHDCRALVKLDTIRTQDCSKVSQTYTYEYLDEATGRIQVATGNLPATVWLPYGTTIVNVILVDACLNRSTGTINVIVEDITPPTPVCDEFTQVTVDPEGCWAAVAAKDLDNGSRDNCGKPLHFAAALMADIEKARSDYETKIVAECGSAEYWNNKSWYDAFIEAWIDCYVFSDSVHLGECGSNQVVLRVYEADGIPLYDPHVFSCSPHAWYCYNTNDLFRVYYDFATTNKINSACTQNLSSWTCKPKFEKYVESIRSLIKQPNQFFVNGNASNQGNGIYRLTPNFVNQGGSIYLNQKFNLDYPFTLEADINIGSISGADGMTFIIQNSSSNALGLLGGNLGARTIPNGVAIAFRSYGSNTASFLRTSDFGLLSSAEENISDLLDQKYHHLIIEYSNDELCYKIGGKSGCLSNIKSVIGSNEAWIGFTAATGSATNEHSVKSIYQYRRSSDKLYSDCMINVLVDDKQAPIVAELEDVVVYCDRAPENAYAPNCNGGEEFKVWPGLLKDKKGVEHGYYGGSDFLGIHSDNDHGTPDACGYDNAHHWAPIYCRSWLYLDSFDSAGKIDPKQYFGTLVLFDKTRATRTLLAKEFSITDNCRLDTTTLTVSDEGTLNGCGEGWIQRTWTITDKCGNTVTAKQKVVVKHRSDFEVIFPEDKVVECDFLNTTDPKDAGEPIISDDECEQVGVQYKDEVFTVEDSACYKIVRTWTLIDWCIYNPNAQFHYSDVIVDDRLRADTGNRSCVYRNLKDNNDGYMKYIQVIKVIDKVAPVVTTRDTTICIYAEDCKSALVRIPFNATDNCTATSELSYRVEVDLNATSTVFTNRTYVKSSIDQTTQSNQIEFVYSPSVAGKHVVHVIVKDNCGNEDTSSYRFELVDCKKPTPYCYNGVATVIMPSTGKITVWAKDLDAGSFDNCTLADNLKFSFSSNSSETSKEFTCADIPDGKSKTIPVDIWVTDEAGNQDHCSTYILLQDNTGNICPDVAGLSVTIAGKIQTETNEPVEHVRVNIYGRALQMNYQTGIKGTYHFEGLPSKSNYSLKSTRDDQPMNGVSTLDLVLIQKHILGIELLDSPYKVLAADVDNDKQITAIDLVELRKLILATYEDLPNNESWRFIPKSTSFADPQNPWNSGAVSEILEMKEVSTDYKSEDFIGLKVGDVNATAAPHSLMGVEVRGNETGLIFEITDQVFNRGDEVRVDFRSPNFRGISGWQGTLSVASSEQRDASLLSDLELIPGSLDMKRENLGLRYAKEGMLTMSWNTNAKSGLDIDDQQVLFTLVFKAQENGKLSEVLRIGSQHTIAESYQGRGELGNLSIRFVQNGNEIVAKSELYQNYPNPFDQRTVIGINLADQGKGTLKVYDATGRTIKSVERDWTKGYHEVWFDRREIGASGVLYYRFESGFFNASKKMILID